MRTIQNRFTGGMNSDLDSDLLPPEMYRDAVNMELTAENGYRALENLKGTDLKYRFPITAEQVADWDTGDPAQVEPASRANYFSFSLNSSYDPTAETSDWADEPILGAFQVTAQYRNLAQSQVYHAPSVVVITMRNTKPPFDEDTNHDIKTNNVYLLNSATGRIHLIFNGYIQMQPNVIDPAEQRQTEIREIDAYATEEGSDQYCYWIDYDNPLRRMRMLVTDDSRYDLRTESASIFADVLLPAFIGYRSDPDLLSVFKLFPPDALVVDDVVPNKGNLPAGSYQAAYQYYNTNDNTQSKFSLFTNPVSIINPITNTDNSQADQLNDVNGALPGALTRKAIRFKINPHPKTGLYSRMSGYFNAVRIVIVKNTDGRVEAQTLAFALSPSEDFYGSAGDSYMTKEFLYTGTEQQETEVIATTVTLGESAMLTAKTVEYNDGRLFLANIKYRAERITPHLSGVKAAQKFLRIQADPMKSQAMNAIPLDDADIAGTGDGINTSFGYSGEMNTCRFRGHWRNELYRPVLGYGDKYGNFFQGTIDCSQFIQRAIPTPITGTQTVTLTGGTLYITKAYVPDSGGTGYFVYGPTNAGTYFLHLHQLGAESLGIKVLGGYTLDGGLKVYSGGGTSTIDFSVSPTISDIGVGFTVTAASLSVAEVDWLENWADPTSKDFKFAPRTDPGGHLFDQWVYETDKDGNPLAGEERIVDYIRVFGMEFTEMVQHPKWAVCIFALRLERKKDILGQSPLVHASAVQGVPTMWNNGNPALSANFTSQYNDIFFGGKFNPDFRLTQQNYDYDGSDDTLLPRFLAYGASRHLTAFRTAFDDTTSLPATGHFNDWTVQWQKQERYETDTSYLRAPAFLAHWLYVPEYMAHYGSITRDKIFFDGTEFLDAVDCVALESYNGLRNGPDLRLGDKISVGVNAFFDGSYSEYAWVFAPYGHDAYFGSGARDAHYSKSLYAWTHAPIPDTSAAPILIKKGFKLDFGFSPQVLDDSYVRRDGPFAGDANTVQYSQNYRQIRWAGNGFSLVKNGMEAQALAGNVLQANLIPPLPENNQRSMLITVDDRSNKYIFDPTDLLTNAEFSQYFGSGFDDAATVKRKLEAEDWWAAQPPRPSGYPATSDGAMEELHDVTFTEKERTGYRHDRLHHNYTMVPGNCILLPIVNVTKKLDDFRYGTDDIQQQAFFTGSYQALDLGLDPLMPNPNNFADASVTLEVFGGDCFISRFPVTVRDNSIAARDMQLAPDVIIDNTPTIRITATNKPQNYSRYVEIMDMWLESEVNGHYVDNRNNLYPFRVRERAAGGHGVPRTDYTPMATKFEYPAIAATKLYSSPRTYQYHQGYSIENILKPFTVLAANVPLLTEATARTVFSAKQVRNTLLRGFDTWLVDDFSDELDLAFGPVTKLKSQGNNRIIAFQERAVAYLMVGQILSYDVNGNTTGLSTSQVIGNTSYLTQAAGTKYLSSVKRMDGIVYFFDSVNLSISVVSEGVKSLSDGRVRTEVKRIFSSDANAATYGNIVGWVDSLGKKYCLFDNGLFLFGASVIVPGQQGIREGLVFNALVNAWETRLVAPAEEAEGGGFQLAYVNALAAGAQRFDVVNKWTFQQGEEFPDGNGEILVFNLADRSLMFGGNKEASATIMANQPLNVPKTFDVVLVNGSGLDVTTPTHTGRSNLQVTVPDANLDTGVIPFIQNRETLFIANQMRSATNQTLRQRMRGAWAREKLIFATSDTPEPNAIILRSVDTAIRESHRTER